MLGAYQDFLVACFGLNPNTSEIATWTVKVNLLEATQNVKKLMKQDEDCTSTTTFEEIRHELGSVLSYLLLILADQEVRIDFSVEQNQNLAFEETSPISLTCSVEAFLGYGCTLETAWGVLYEIYFILERYNSDLAELVIWNWRELLRMWEKELQNSPTLTA